MHTKVNQVSQNARSGPHLKWLRLAAVATARRFLLSPVKLTCSKFKRKKIRQLRKNNWLRCWLGKKVHPSHAKQQNCRGVEGSKRK